MSSKAVTWIFILLLLFATYMQSSMSLQTENKNRVASQRNTMLSSTSTTIHHSGLPKVDEIYFKAYPGATPETVVNKFLDGQTDWIIGPSRSDLYQLVVDAGHKVSEMCPEAEFTFFPINCRDCKLQSGDPNAPLNDSNWRIALSYVYGVDDKQNDSFGYYGVPWQYAIWNPVPDAQLPWYNATIRMPDTDFNIAWSILSAAGYDNSTNWLRKDGLDVRLGGTIDCIYSTGSTFYPDGPLGGMADNWNDFLTYLGLNGPKMTVAPTDFVTLVTELMSAREYDIIAIGLTNLGRYVDWIYDLSHSSTDVDWGWNFCGIHDPDFDTWSEIILTDLVVENVIAAASDWQEKFVYELMPWVPVRAGLEFCTLANDSRGELTNLISMDNYGPRNDWSWMCLHWKGEPDVVWPGGSYTAALGDEPHSLNPWTEYSPYGWEIMDRALLTGETGLLGVNPITLRNMPFVATNWTVDHWTSIPELGITDGSTATFYLRQDVTWHDGYPVTAYDCVYNMRTMRTYHPGPYSGSWAHLVYEEADGPYKFNAYFDCTSLYHADNIAGSALLAAKHITQTVEQHVEDGTLDSFFDWDPAFNTYEDLMGIPPPVQYPFMKQIVGCGPFVFDYYNRNSATGRVVKYEDFFVNAPVIGGVVGEWRTSPNTNYTYKPLVHNLAAKENSPMGELIPVIIDVKIYEDDELVHEVTDLNLDPWEWACLGPYTTHGLTGGGHTIRVEVYDNNTDDLIHTYIHTMLAIIREDITTYTGEFILGGYPPDFTVDMRDVGRAARAFGSYPGHLRWDPGCDVNDDFEVDMRDIGAIARKFGWVYE